MAVHCESAFCDNNDKGVCVLEDTYFIYKITGGGVILICENNTDQ